MVTFSTRVASIAALVAIAACSRGANPGLPPAAPAGASIARAVAGGNAGATGNAKIAVTIPKNGGAAHAGGYVSPSTLSMTVDAAGAAAKTFELTPNAPGCKRVKASGALACTETLALAAGTRTIAATLYDAANGRGDALSTAHATVKVLAGKTAKVDLTFNGVVKNATVLLDGKSRASVPAGTAATLAVTVQASDAKGNRIGGTAKYATPVTLSARSIAGTSLSATAVAAPNAKTTLKYSGVAIPAAVNDTITPSVGNKPQPNGAAVLSIVLTAPAVSLSTLAFSSAAAQPVVVQEKGYSGTLHATSSDTSVATVSPANAKGPRATIAVTPAGGGTCTITVADAAGKKATVKVSISSGVIVVSAKHG